MKRYVVLLAVAAVFALAGWSWGQGPGPAGQPGVGPWVYNPQTVTTVKGTVESLAGGPSLRARRGITTLILKTDQGGLTVHLGPHWYLRQQGIVPKAGDALEVTGSQVTQDSQSFLIAREVKVDGSTLKLRDEQGLPLWPAGRPVRAPQKAVK